MIIIKCLQCGKEFEIYPSSIGKKKFCSKSCKYEYLHLHHKAPHLSEFNRNSNRKNKKEGWTLEERERASKREQARLGACSKDTYIKHLGRHFHREIAEQKLGRKLLPGEIVHHIDGDKHNNAPENLQVMTQSEHARIHFSKKKSI